jgi:hypothetical protein
MGHKVLARSRHASTVCTSGCTIASARVLRYRPGNHGHYLRHRDGRKCPVGKNEGCEETGSGCFVGHSETIVVDSVDELVGYSWK